jgi:actin-related protein 5
MQRIESTSIDYVSYLRTSLPRRNVNVVNEVIIDYGSSTTKAGYFDSQQPELVFRSLVNKMKDPKTMQTISLIGGNDIFRGNYQSPYELNLIHHSGLLESINDYIFSSLGFTTTIPPLCITECVANTEYSRSTVFEQMFECYQVPRLLVGVDSLFALFYNTPNGLSGYLN